MNDGTLTNDTYYIFNLIYKEYLKKKRKENSTLDACDFSAEELIEIVKNDENKLDFALNELEDNSFVKIFITGDIELTKDGINYMENRLGKSINKVIEKISKLVNVDKQ